MSLFSRIVAVIVTVTLLEIGVYFLIPWGQQTLAGTVFLAVLALVIFCIGAGLVIHWLIQLGAPARPGPN